jgi:hypothetical protein
MGILQQRRVIKSHLSRRPYRYNVIASRYIWMFECTAYVLGVIGVHSIAFLNAIVLEMHIQPEFCNLIEFFFPTDGRRAMFYMHRAGSRCY